MLPKDPARPLSILCLGAHSDDIEIGCGGTILHFLDRYDELSIYWIVFSAKGPRAEEARTSARRFLGRSRSRHTVRIEAFRDGFFPAEWVGIKECMFDIRRDVEPDLIFTHYRDDRHQDHRTISDLTWNTFRNHFILEYEIPKFDGDLGLPNTFVHVSDAVYERKLTYLRESFPTQTEKPWFSEDTFRGLSRIRGVESRAPARYAEAFHCRKWVLR
jgi:LmbE family N-acetylglucosaminyl deacetylase